MFVSVKDQFTVSPALPVAPEASAPLFCSASELGAASGCVRDAVAEGFGPPSGSVPVVVAVFATDPASTSVWVSL